MAGTYDHYDLRRTPLRRIQIDDPEGQRDGLNLLESRVSQDCHELPRELIKLAKAHDLSVPGAMLPGPPKEWDRLYGPRPVPKAPAGEE